MTRTLLLLAMVACNTDKDDVSDTATTDTDQDTDTDAGVDTDPGADTDTDTGDPVADALCGTPHVPGGLEAIAGAAKLYDHVDGCVVVQIIDTGGTGKIHVVQLSAAGQAAMDVIPSQAAFTDFGVVSDDGSVASWVDNDGVHVGRFDGASWTPSLAEVGFLTVDLAPDGSLLLYQGAESLTATIDGSTPPVIGSPSTLPAGAEITGASGGGEWIVYTESGLVMVSDLAGTVIEVSVSDDGTSGGGLNGALSHDGRFVVFQSASEELVGDDTNGDDDIFLHDRDSDEDGTFDEPGEVRTVRVSVASDGTEGNPVHRWEDPSISGDGRFITFSGAGTGLVTDPINTSDSQVYVHDVQTGETALVSLVGPPLVVGDDNNGALIAPGGETVAFVSGQIFAPTAVYFAPNPLF